MPILFVNGKRRGLRIRGRAAVGNSARYRHAASNPPRRGPHGTVRIKRTPKDKFVKRLLREGYMPSAAEDSWRRAQERKRYARGLRRGAKTNPARKARRRRRGGARARAHDRGFAALAAYNRKRKRRHITKRGRRARRSNAMAKGSRKRAAAMKRYWRKRKAAGKKGGLGRTKRRRARRVGAPKRRRARARRVGAPKRRRARKRSRKRSARRRSRRRTRRGGGRTRRTNMRGKMTRRARRRATVMVLPPGSKTLRMNPSRRRRRKHSRRRHRRVHRRGHRRRYRRGYRRNPGGVLLDMLKRVVPVAAGFVIARAVVNKIGPMLPGVSSLGTLQGPVMSIAALLGVNFATKKIGALAKHKEGLLMGASFQALASLWSAFAPASVQAMLGVGDYVQMGDYIAVGGAPPLRENFTLSDYIAVGGDGVEEELGLEEELGVEEELGDARLGGLPGPTSGGLLKQIPTQAFMQPVPARSFTKQIPAAGSSYDNAAELYGGIFAGKFGGGG